MELETYVNFVNARKRKKRDIFFSKKKGKSYLSNYCTFQFELDIPRTKQLQMAFNCIYIKLYMYYLTAYISNYICIIIMYYITIKYLTITKNNKIPYNNKKRRIWNARSKNLSISGTGNKYSMVWVFSGSIDRDQSFFPRCVDIPLFFILVINVPEGGVKKRRLEIQLNICDN